MAKAKIYITPKKGVLDPVGKTVEASLHSLGYKNVSNVHIGKYIELEIGGNINSKQAQKQVEEMSKKLLANLIIEDFRFEVE